AAQERLEVKGSSADEEDPLSTALDVPATGRGLFEPPGDAGRLPRVEDIDEVMPDATTLFLVRLGRADVHAPVQGHGIHGNDFRAKAPSQLNAKLCLPRSRWTGQDEAVLKRWQHPNRIASMVRLCALTVHTTLVV